MILELNNASLQQRCQCKRERQVNFSRLEAGVHVSGVLDHRVVRMPECPECGAVEFLNRVLEPVAALQNHHKMVNALHFRLVGDGRVNELCAGAIEGEEAPGEDTRTAIPFSPAEAKAEQAAERERVAAEIEAAEAAKAARAAEGGDDG